MDKKETINIQQFAILVAIYTTGSSILIVPYIVTMYGKNNGWIIEILNMCIGLSLVAFYNKLAKSFQHQYYFEYIDTIMGKWAGKLISLLYLSFLMVFATGLLGEVGEFIGIAMLEDTPNVPILGLLIFIIIIGVRYGLATLARSGEIFFPWLILLLSILLLFLIPKAHSEHLLPFFPEGIKPFFLTIYTSLALPYFELFVILILFPHVNNQEKRGKAFLLGVSIGSIIIILITLFTILVLGHEPTARHHFPSFTMAKTINIGHTIERIEVFLSAIWFLTIYMKTSLVFYASSLLIKHIFNLQTHKAIIAPLGLVLTFMPLTLSNVIELRNFVAHYWFPLAGTYAVFFPFLIFAVDKVKSKWKKGAHHVHE